MKLLISMFVFVAFLCGVADVADAADQPIRPTIVFFYVDGLKAGEMEKGAIRQETIDRFAKKYARDYTLIGGDAYKGEFVVSRFTDLLSLDRFDLLPRLAADRVDYAVFYAVLPLQTKRDSLFQLVTTKSLVHVRVFDLHKNAYVADTILTYTSNWAWLSGHFEKLFADADSKVFAVQFPLRI